MYCNRCGMKSDEMYTFCVNCGSPLQSESTSNFNGLVEPRQESQPPEKIYYRQDGQISEAQATLLEPQGIGHKSNSSNIVVIIIAAILLVGAIVFVINLFSNDPYDLTGTWTLHETYGSIPDSTPNHIIFTGESGRGNGYFIDAFWGVRVDFEWQFNSTEFFMSRVPGTEGIVGFWHGAAYGINPEGDTLIIEYGNGSIAIFRRR